MRFQIDCRPANEASSSGDFAEYVYVDSSRSVVVVGDVAGRGRATGVAADRLRARVRSLFGAQQDLAWGLSELDTFFTAALLSDETPFASLFVAYSDSRRPQLRYASAGHEPALLFNISTSHTYLASTGPLLGIGGLGTTAPFFERAVPFHRDSLLVVVTGGITNAVQFLGPDASRFGSAGVAKAVREASIQRGDTARAIYRAAARHAGAALGDACVLIASLSP